MASLKKICKRAGLLLAILLGFVSCAEDSIFPPIPLTLNPLVLANPIALVASPAQQRLYVANSNNRVNYFDSSFVVLDISNPINPVPLAVISIPNYSGQMILDEARGFVYIPNRQSSDASDSEDQILRINIDESSPDFLTVELIPSAANPFGAFMQNNLLYVAAVQAATLYDVTSFAGYSSVNLQVTSNLDEEVNAELTRQLAVAPSGQNLFVTNEDGLMLILNIDEFTAPIQPGITDLGTEAVDYVVMGTSSTTGIARGAEYLYVVDADPSSLKIMTDQGLEPVVGPPLQIASSSLQVASIPVGNDPGEVVVDELNGRAYVSNTGDDNISVIDLGLQQEIARVSISTTEETLFESGNIEDGDQPFAMALYELGGVNYLYVAHFQTNLISILNADTLEILNRIP